MKNRTKDLRIFAFIWSLIFLTTSLYQGFLENTLSVAFLVFSIALLLLGCLKPLLLTSPYEKWILIGEFIGGIVSKVVLFVLYFMLFTPISLILKILNKDLLSKKIDKNRSTYWVEREKQPESMKNQF